MNEIESYDTDYILNVSIEDLCDYLEEKHIINPLIIRGDNVYIKNQGEVDVDVSYDHRRAISDRSRPFYLKGTSVTFAIPFEGDRDLLFCQPSSFTLSPPRGQVTNNEILITYEEVDPDPAKTRAAFEKTVGEIERYAENVNKDIRPFNDGLRNKTKQKIEQRKEKILRDKGFVQSLGYPIKEAPDMPKTYEAPKVRRKITIQKPTATTTPFVPEPTLEMKNYEAILKVVSNMVLVMERSPRAFKDMEEEDLRQHFLVQLNGQFQGEATGETFNFEGKTDILIRYEGKNIFIAECMFWSGEKSLLDKINQLLGYTSWRDTKTALLVFNRNVEFSKVLAQIPEATRKHPNYKRQLEYNSESGFRFILHHKNDKNREIILTVLAFDVPK
ncbi:MAG: hypothetical protein JRJ03_18620 [Deltaproteobacteria bacterium]|nr:hypothetical protein [Deltaproteobacteria bacterium]